MMTMPLLIGALVVLIILYIVWYIRLDCVDKRALKNAARYAIKNPGMSAELPFKKIAKYIPEVLSLPFRPISHFSILSEGSVYGLVHFDKNFNNLLNDKVHWAHLFEKHNILYPKTVAYTDGNDVVNVNGWDRDKTYVSKPRYGMLGIGVHRVSGDNVSAELRKKDIIIQDLLKDCRLEKVRSFRCVTLHDGSIFQVYEFTSPTKGLGTHRAYGGSVRMCNNCPAEVYELTKRLGDVHSAEHPDIFSIGWDVMMNCGDTYSAYALEGNIAHCAWFYPDAYDVDAIKEFKKKFAIHSER